MKTIFIGVGNTFRSDDGAGIYIVRALAKQFGRHSHYVFAESHGEGTSLMELWQGNEHVVLFDAVMLRDDPGKLYHLEANRKNIPTDFFKYSSHAFSVAEAVELSRVLDKLPAKFEIYGIEGEHFAHGESLSAPVKRSCDQLIQELSSTLVA